MLVEVTKDYVPHIGKRGDRKELPNRAATALIALGSVKLVTEPAVKPKKPRVYKRTDMQAETPAAPAKGRRYARRDVEAEDSPPATAVEGDAA